MRRKVKTKGWWALNLYLFQQDLQYIAVTTKVRLQDQCILGFLNIPKLANLCGVPSKAFNILQYSPSLPLKPCLYFRPAYTAYHAYSEHSTNILIFFALIGMSTRLAQAIVSVVKETEGTEHQSENEGIMRNMHL